MTRRLFALVAGCLSAGCGGTDPPLPDNLALEPAYTGFTAPIFLAAPEGDPRIFVAEQGGLIRVVVPPGTQPEATPFLDLRGKLSAGGERGLLGFAFHPQFAENGFFYVNYTDLNGDTKIERYHADPAGNVADAATASPVLSIAQPYPNHNGGMLLFGPDGMLYVGTGDGGSGGDPLNNAQTLTTLLGKMLRIDVNVASGYAVPPDNPYVGMSSALPEIWGIGLRNPWRYAFDAARNLLYVADVGQNAWEEVHVVSSIASPVNYGWKVMEGQHCYQNLPCDQTLYDFPVIEYSHQEGCSITGGFVYRGREIPGLRGRYLYSDFCSGFLRSFNYEDGEARERREWAVPQLENVMSFGQDAAGELYILTGGGMIYRIIAGA